MGRVLIVTYYWPPAGGVAVQRVCHLARYLKKMNWDVTVLTVDEGGYALTDTDLLASVAAIDTIKAASFEPQKYLGLSGQKKGPATRAPKTKAGEQKKKVGLLKKLFNFILQFVRLNFFIPDSRVGWIKPASKRGIEWSKQQSPDIVVSSAPPYSTHFVARAIAKEMQVPWVADFRDPWLENLTYNVAPRFPWVKWLTARLEKSVLREADAVTCTGWCLKDLYASKIDTGSKHKFHVIPNGYDVDQVLSQTKRLEKFTITYIGTLYPHGLSPAFFEQLGMLLRQRQDLRETMVLRFVGTVDASIQSMIQAHIPEKNLEYVGFVSSDKVVEFLSEEQLLLLFMYDVPHNECITLGKVYDYLKTPNPILSIGPSQGDTATILADHGETVIENHDTDKINAQISHYFDRWQHGALVEDREVLDAYKRSHQAKQFSDLFVDLIKGD